MEKAANSSAEKTSASVQKNEKPPKGFIREWVETIVTTLLMATFGMTFIVQAVTVPTGSMQNTILISDYLLVNKFIFGAGQPLPFLPQREIKRGDIVVFKYPGNKLDPRIDIIEKTPAYQTHFVKRVIGLPGETVEFRDNRVYVDGKMLAENRLVTDDAGNNSAMNTKPLDTMPDASYAVTYSDTTAEMVANGEDVAKRFEFGVAGRTMKVPDDSYFMMGDNRDNSADSRVWGFVQRDLVVGRAMFVYWSCDRGKVTSEGINGVFQCIANGRWSRIGKVVK